MMAAKTLTRTAVPLEMAVRIVEECALYAILRFTGRLPNLCDLDLECLGIPARDLVPGQRNRPEVREGMT